MSESPQKSLSAEEIEALLRAARENAPAVRSDIPSSEPLGPGDVQHLQNTAFSPKKFPDNGWSNEGLAADELLRQAEQQLAEALSVDRDPVRRDFVPLRPSAQQPKPIAAPVPPPASSGIPKNVIDDIELDVTLELGRAELTIAELLQLREGSVVPLNRMAGDPIDILANGRLVARGEVIVVDGKFGVRICEVVSPR